MNNNSAFIMISALVVGSGIGYYGANYMAKQSGSCKIMANENEYVLRRAMGKLWVDHVIWTRQFIVSSVAGLGDVEAITQRLLKNQDDIGAAVAKYYGQDAGDQLAKLLKEHIIIAGDIVNAAIAKNNAKVKSLDNKWHVNAVDIAEFLSKANSNWPKQALIEMLNKHLELTTKELQLRLAGNWNADIANFDEIFEQIRGMAKALSDGIIAQFPNKF